MIKIFIVLSRKRTNDKLKIFQEEDNWDVKLQQTKLPCWSEID